ncbi:MAG: dTDP-4-dehydrorhamnose reductase [Chloroflexi bacterium ADurb.Bin180]|nr:MAG: dTDP-4-dehydrorhamnose reductase [Chloroflexi bacterium ADurb.Bin180]
MKVAITGSAGQLGLALQGRLTGHELLLLDLPQYDIGNHRQTREAITSFRPEVVVHAAAFTNVDACESDPVSAYRVNALGTQNVAVACQECGAAMVHVSTDYVFDGCKNEPYWEWDPPNPQSTYARSKLAGEQIASTLLQRCYIVRTAWLYSRQGKNFVKSVLRLADERERLQFVTDEVGSPTYAPDLAEAIARLIPSGLFGIYHFTNSGVCSRFEWARAILELAGLDPNRVQPTQGFARAAKVPARSELRNFNGATQLGIVFRPWRDALEDYFRGD